jgi:NAD(P)H-flavin reductase
MRSLWIALLVSQIFIGYGFIQSPLKQPNVVNSARVASVPTPVLNVNQGGRSKSSLALSLDQPLFNRNPTSAAWRQMFFVYIAFTLSFRTIRILTETIDIPDFVFTLPRFNGFGGNKQRKTRRRKNDSWLPNINFKTPGFLRSMISDFVSFSDRLQELVFIDMFPFLKLWYRITASKTSLVLEKSWKFVDELLDLDPPDVVDLREWGVCTLAGKELLPGGYTRYRFELEGENAAIPLELGQEILMCVVDQNDNVIKEPCFPVSSSSARGYFEIITKRGGEASGDRFAKALSSHDLGDEMAYKGGRYRFNYLGNKYPIEGLSLIASGLGGCSALQIMKNILTEDSTTIDDLEMLWVNENKSDFIVDKEVEEMEFRYLEKVTISRMIQDDLYGRGLTKRNDVKNAITPFNKGRLGVICAPEYVIGKARNLFTDLGYPQDEIITIVTSS